MPKKRLTPEERIRIQEREKAIYDFFHNHKMQRYSLYFGGENIEEIISPILRSLHFSSQRACPYSDAHVS